MPVTNLVYQPGIYDAILYKSRASQKYRQCDHSFVSAGGLDIIYPSALRTSLLVCSAKLRVKIVCGNILAKCGKNPL